MIACGQQNNMTAFVCFTSIIKDPTAKARSFGIKCVSLLDINFDVFALAKLQQQISFLNVVMKRI